MIPYYTIYVYKYDFIWPYGLFVSNNSSSSYIWNVRVHGTVTVGSFLNLKKINNCMAKPFPAKSD